MGHGDANTLVHYVQQSDGASAAAAAGKDTADVLGEIYTGPKAQLRPIHDRIMSGIAGFGTFEIAPKKGYVSLRRKKQFAMIGPATNTRVEVGLNMKDVKATDRLVAMPSGQMCRSQGEGQRRRGSQSGAPRLDSAGIRRRRLIRHVLRPVRPAVRMPRMLHLRVVPVLLVFVLGLGSVAATQRSTPPAAGTDLPPIGSPASIACCSSTSTRIASAAPSRSCCATAGQSTNGPSAGATRRPGVR